MSRNNNRGRRWQTPAAGPVHQALTSLKNKLEGKETFPPFDPPAYVKRPWAPMTYEKLHTSSAAAEGESVSVQEIIAEVKHAMV